MESATLGLLGETGDMVSPAVQKLEKGYVGMSPEVSSYTNEAEIELGLGLSIGSGGGGGGGSKWGKIMTAKDFPSGFSGSGGGGGGCGTKRAVDCIGYSASTGVSQIVGWPPIRAYRMNSLTNQSGASTDEEGKGVGGNDTSKDPSMKKINHGGNGRNNSGVKERRHLGFVKVNLDGLPIGRKVDLNAYACYGTLAQTIEEMFFANTISIGREKGQSTQPSKLLDGSSEFVLTYEDKEGDWMLVGDVPWGMFLSTVKRLRIMKTSEAHRLAPRLQEGKDIQKSKPI